METSKSERINPKLSQVAKGKTWPLTIIWWLVRLQAASSNEWSSVTYVYYRGILYVLIALESYSLKDITPVVSAGIISFFPLTWPLVEPAVYEQPITSRIKAVRAAKPSCSKVVLGPLHCTRRHHSFSSSLALILSLALSRNTCHSTPQHTVVVNVGSINMQLFFE